MQRMMVLLLIKTQMKFLCASWVKSCQFIMRANVAIIIIFYLVDHQHYNHRSQVFASSSASSNINGIVASSLLSAANQQQQSASNRPGGTVSPIANAWSKTNVANAYKQQQQLNRNNQSAALRQKSMKQTSTAITLANNNNSNIKTNNNDDNDVEPPNPNINNAGHNITRILTAFFEHGYDKRVRPNYSGPPAMVNVSFHIIGISSVSEVQMDFTTDFYFRQKWYDPRLMFEPIGEIKELCVGAEFAEKIWLPDTFFANEKTATFHKATTENTFIRIAHTGRVYRSIRLTVTCSCPMDLQYFPMDRQRCKIEIESYGYNTRDIDYRWEKGNESVSMDTKIELPQFKILGHRMGHELQNLSSGDYIRLYCEIHFVRSMGYYLIQIYIPASLIVIISWVSFWLHRNATPARVALGVTTVLTMTTLMSSTNAALPKISYVKSIDVFLGTCFVMVFASLLEYATVGYVGKRINMKSKRQQDQQRLHQHHQKVCLAAAAAAATSNAGATSTSGVAMAPTTAVSGFSQHKQNLDPHLHQQQLQQQQLLQQQQQQQQLQIFKSPNLQQRHVMSEANFVSDHINKKGPIVSYCQQQSDQLRQQQQQKRLYLANQQQQLSNFPATQRRRSMSQQQHQQARDAIYTSQTIAVHRHLPDSEPIYGQRSAIKVLIDNASSANGSGQPIYRSQQSVNDDTRTGLLESVNFAVNDMTSHQQQIQQQQQQLLQMRTTNSNQQTQTTNLDNSQTSNQKQTTTVSSAPVTSSAGPNADSAEGATAIKDMIRICGCTPSSIDKYSRVLFPICFVCFNLMYWIIYGHISGQVDDKGAPLIDFIKS